MKSDSADSHLSKLPWLLTSIANHLIYSFLFLSLTIHFLYTVISVDVLLYFRCAIPKNVVYLCIRLYGLTLIWCCFFLFTDRRHCHLYGSIHRRPNGISLHTWDSWWEIQSTHLDDQQVALNYGRNVHSTRQRYYN